MKKEEFIVFPFIRKLERAKELNQFVSSPLFGWLSNPVNMMMDDHAAEGKKFRRIASLTNGYQVPDASGNAFALTYQLLEEFERDLHIHIHLENNILFPKAIELEKEVNVSGPF
jgi:regulator of cell morphogenesis and NO signaling